MTIEQYMKKVTTLLTPEQVVLVNPCIFFNPEYPKLKQHFEAKEYEKCYEYIKKNQDLLSVKNVPEEHRKQVNDMLINIRLLNL